MFKNILLIFSCLLLLAACGGKPAEEETTGEISPVPTAQTVFSQKINEGGQIGESLPLVGKVFGELPVVGEEDPVYCNLPENVQNWDDIIPLCIDPLYGIFYYVDYGGDDKIHAIYNGEKQIVLDLPGKRLFCRGGKLYFLLESYNRFGFEGAKSGNIAEYDPVTGAVKIIVEKTFSSIVVYQDMIYCRCQGEEQELEKELGYTVKEDFWFYFFDTGELVAAKETAREYVMDFRRYGEYFLAVTLEESKEDPRYDVPVGTELRKWDGERGTVWKDIKLMPSDSYYIREGYFFWLDLKGFHQWNPVSGEDQIHPWKLGTLERYILVGDWLVGNNYMLIHTGEGEKEKWISADEGLGVCHEFYTDGETIYAIAGPFDYDMEDAAVFRQVRIEEAEIDGYQLRFETVGK